MFIFNKCGLELQLSDIDEACYTLYSFERKMRCNLVLYKILYYDICDYFGVDEVGYKLRQLNNFYKRKSNLYKRVTKLLDDHNCLFLTLTFTNEYLNEYFTNQDRDYVSLKAIVRKWLKNFHTDYICNIDFGKQNERVHFHCLIALDYIEYDSWHYGNMDFKKVVNCDSKAIGSYILKLTNHAIKNSTKENRVMYSRTKRK